MSGKSRVDSKGVAGYTRRILGVRTETGTTLVRLFVEGETGWEVTGPDGTGRSPIPWFQGLVGVRVVVSTTTPQKISYGSGGRFEGVTLDGSLVKWWSLTSRLIRRQETVQRCLGDLVKIRP